MKRLPVMLTAAAAALAVLSSAAGQPAPAASGDALLAAGDFAPAAKAYEAALKASPQDADALAGLASIRLYENRLDDAIALAGRALALAPSNTRAQATLGTARLRQAAFAPERWRISGLQAQVDVPFTSTDPLPVMPVSVGEHQTLFVIDTGAPDVMVSADLVKALGLQTQEAGQGVFLGGNRRTVERTLVPQLQLGQIGIADAPAGVMPQALGMPGGKIEGIVGTGLLMHFLPTLDYCQNRLVLRPRSASGEVEKAAARAKANIVPMWLAGDHFILARAHLLHGGEHLFLIDTGLGGGGFVAKKPVLDEAGVAIDPSLARTGMGGGGAATVIPIHGGAMLGSLTVEDMPGAYTPGGDPLGAFPFQVAGLLSHSFFRHTRLTLDFEAMRLITEPC